VQREILTLLNAALKTQRQEFPSAENRDKESPFLPIYWKEGNDAMQDAVVEVLILDLLEWLAKRERTYDEVMDAWRTSCPKLPVWEDANDRGLVMKETVHGRCIVRTTPSGHRLLEQHRIPKPSDC
jgi:hypothetical protein